MRGEIWNHFIIFFKERGTGQRKEKQIVFSVIEYKDRNLYRWGLKALFYIIRRQERREIQIVYFFVSYWTQGEVSIEAIEAISKKREGGKKSYFNTWRESFLSELWNHFLTVFFRTKEGRVRKDRHGRKTNT